MEEKSLDLKILESRQELIDKINTLNLPISVISYLLKDIIQIVDSQLNVQIANEKKAIEQESKK